MGIKDIVDRFNREHKTPEEPEVVKGKPVRANSMGVQTARNPILQAMSAQSLTCSDLAKMVAISQSYASQVASGRVVPKPWIQRRVALALGREVGELWPKVTNPHPKAPAAPYAFVREAVHRAGLSIPQAAAAMGASKGALYYLINGQTKKPRKALAHGLRVLLGEVE